MRNASEIYEDLQKLLEEVEQLEASGRVKMSTDSWNTDWQNTPNAFTAVRTSLQVAIDATRWMDTAPADARAKHS